MKLWELDHKEGWAPKNWWFWTVVLETLESPLDCKEMSILKEINPEYSLADRTDAEASVLWPPDVKSWLIWKDPDAEKDWGQEEKGTTEDEMVGWDHRLNGREFEQALGVGDGRRSLVMDRKPGVSKSQIPLSDWTTASFRNKKIFFLNGKFNNFLIEIYTSI